VFTLQEGEGKINVFKANGGFFAKDLQVDRKLIVGAIQKDSHIQDKGIRVGDQLISIIGAPVQTVDIDQTVQELAKIHGDQPVEFEFHRDLPLRPESEINRTDSNSLDDKDIHNSDTGSFTVMLNLMDPQDGENLLINEMRIAPLVSGLGLTEPVRITKYNLVTAWGRGIQESFSMVSQALSMVGQLVTGEVSPELLSGPVGIVSATAETARFGFRELIYFAGFISVNLAFVNLLPIPIADGGLILFFIIEKLRGKPLGNRNQLIIQQVSIVLIIGLFLYITWFDLIGIFK
ncbi:MAG: RIP metalloprotease, partial [Candidatus Poribacteria bacterium]|nr:RIP metalloprotease [Candidatus Poribacteria bacterium]